MKVNALQIRQSLGSVLAKLSRADKPIIIEKNREPVAVLISMKMFKERFIDFQEQQKRDELFEAFKSSARPAKSSSLDELRKLRYG